jgi:predicted AAA+ superfamily ATPase
MAKSTRTYVFEGMELLPDALTPFVEKRLEASLTGHWQVTVVERVQGLRPNSQGAVNWDQPGLLKTMMAFWNDAFRTVLGHAERSLVSELLEVRNRLSHNETFSFDDAERALDSMRRLLQAISAKETADEIGSMRDIILRRKFSELQRVEERRKGPRLELNTETAKGLLSWRDVIEPHEDVATGEFQQAEFAADMGKVHEGSAASEYANPKEFYSRTFLTDGLSTLLLNAAKRLSGKGGDPVVELQTNFGGGKTHSMLALYHMAGEAKSADLSGLDQLLSDGGFSIPVGINRAVLVGTSRGPMDVIKVDGQTIRTTWGELAWQLGGKAGFALVADADEKGISPGSNTLETLFKAHSPCLILIDEWVAYLRQVYKVEGLPSGSFDANLSFVQSLTEAVKAVPDCLLVASLPASQIEVGGEGGQEALQRLKQTFSRIQSSWRPASQEESYEIVRRRLFKEIPGDRYQHRDNTIKQFAKLYRENADDFPRDIAEGEYQRRMEKAYPIHPALFHQLDDSWGSIENFQRTRGVLRLMAQVIHDLWMSQDPSVMIMPGSVPVGNDRVESEIDRYLGDNWKSIISSDIDGERSTPYEIDREFPNLNRYSAARRVARAVFLGTAPTSTQQNKGLDEKQIALAVVQPGERTAVFSDATRRLAGRAKFMHGDQGRYWYDTTASLNRLASDKAAQLEAALVRMEIDNELRQYVGTLSDRGHFDTIQTAPKSSAEVPDEIGGVRAVILGVAHPHTGRDGSAAMIESKDIFLQRGTTPRVYRNTLIFIAADQRNLDLVEDALRSALAWESIVKNAERLSLQIPQLKMAEEKVREMRESVLTRIKEAWCQILYPVQETAQSDVIWESSKIAAQDGLLTRASKKLASDQVLWPEIGPEGFDRFLQKYIWNEQPRLSLRDVWEYVNRYTYLPRMKNQSVLVEAVRKAVGGLHPGPFAYAERWDESDGSYRGLAIESAMNAPIMIDGDSVLVAADEAERNRPKPISPDTTAPQDPGTPIVPGGLGDTTRGDRPGSQPDPQVDGETIVEDRPRRFSGTVFLNSERPANQMRQVIEGIIEQLTGIEGADVTLRLDIDAEIPSGIDRAKVRTLLENASTLGFDEKDVR